MGFGAGCCGCAVLIAVVVGVLAAQRCAFGLASGALADFQGERAELTGSYKVGSLRGRLPAAADRKCGLFVQLYYPMDGDAEHFKGQDFRFWRREVIDVHYNNNEHNKAPVSECELEAILGGTARLKPGQLEAKSGGWPITIFASGLSGSVEGYQQIGSDLASNGMIVVALEFEDGAGEYATNCDGKTIPYNSPGEGPEVWKPENIIPFRRPQLDERVLEYDATIGAIQGLADGSIKGKTPIEVVLRGGDPKRMMMVAHSFGACSAWYYMRHVAKQGKPSPFIGAVLMDQWTPPIRDEEYEDTQLREPFVFLTSDTPKPWSSRFPLAKLCEINPQTCWASGGTIGTKHNWIHDLSVIFPEAINAKTGELGAGMYRAYFRATMLALQASTKAFLEPTLLPKLNETILEIDPKVLVPDV